MSEVGVSSSIVFGPSNDCRWVFKASPTLWCHVVVHFEEKMSRFSAVFEDDCPEIARPSPNPARS